MHANFSQTSSGLFATWWIVAILGCAQAHANDATIHQFIRERLAGSWPTTIATAQSERAALEELYRLNGFNALWYQDGRLTQPAVGVSHLFWIHVLSLPTYLAIPYE